MAEREKNVLITGASGGIGSAAAERLAALGWRVFATARSRTGAEELAKRVEGAVPLEVDLTDEASIGSCAAEVDSLLGDQGLDGLVNNAGIIVQGPLELVKPEALRRQFEVNVIGQVAITQALLPALRRARGRVVNIGAASGRVTVPMLGPISASKSALESVTDALRMELRHQGVGVSIIEPGAMETEIFAKAADQVEREGFAGGADTQAIYGKALAKMQEAMADTRLGQPSSVAKAIVTALTARSPRTRYVVGRDARQIELLRKLPDRARDRALLSTFGIKASAFE
jgi:NAD(P)-dependent dehydrogenase (short-subunit alcohol dehydrogenase family)